MLKGGMFSLIPWCACSDMISSQKEDTIMKYILTQGIRCGLIIPDGKQLEIDGFIFLPDFEGGQLARHIQTEVEAQTKEEAQRKAHKRFTQFLSKLTLVDNGAYTLSGSF